MRMQVKPSAHPVQTWCHCLHTPSQAGQQHPPLCTSTSVTLSRAVLCCIFVFLPPRFSVPDTLVFNVSVFRRQCRLTPLQGELPDPERPCPRLCAHLSCRSCHRKAQFFPWLLVPSLMWCPHRINCYVFEWILL